MVLPVNLDGFGAVHDTHVLDTFEVLRAPHHTLGSGDQFALLLHQPGNVVRQPAAGIREHPTLFNDGDMRLRVQPHDF